MEVATQARTESNAASAELSRSPILGCRLAPQGTHRSAWLAPPPEGKTRVPMMLPPQDSLRVSLKRIQREGRYVFCSGEATIETNRCNWPRALWQIAALAKFEKAHPYRFRDTVVDRLLDFGRAPRLDSIEEALATVAQLPEFYRLRDFGRQAEPPPNASPRGHYDKLIPIGSALRY